MVATETSEQAQVWKILEALQKRGQLSIEKSQSDALTLAKRRFSPLNKNELQTLRHLSNGGFEKDKSLYIEPPKREVTVAALRCHWNFSRSPRKFNLYVGLWLSGKEFVGFRYETPEEGCNHNYYHAQPCRSMGSCEIAEAIPIPERNPTFPLKANSAVDLLLCVVVSLRGMVGLRELKGDIPGHDGPLHKAFDGMLARLSE